MKNKYKYLKISVLICFCMTLFFSSANATNYYVSALTGDNANTGLSTTTAKRSIQNAADLTDPGDTVFIMNGTYSDARWTNSNHYTMMYLTRSGNSSGYITYKNYPGHSPKIMGVNCKWRCVSIKASYIVIDGLDFEGNNANITLTEATQAFNDVVNGVASVGDQGKYNTSCISIDEANHVIVRNCKVHDFSAGGIGAGPADYITIENNKVYNNSWYTMYATSGISVLAPKPIDAVTSYKIIIRNNIVYSNKTQVPWYTGTAPYHLSDGNGIILDVNNGASGTSVYTGRTLVENNVCYNNGGGGIHSFRANHVDIINNTAYNNGTVMGPDYPEIDGGWECTDNKIYNNIMYARTGGACNSNTAGVTYDYNVYYNGTVNKQGANDILNQDPKFVAKGLDGNADFMLLNTSPAINSGSTTAGQFSTKDILGITRPQGPASDRGAYESAYSPATNLVTNPTFDTNTSGWNLTFNSPGAGSIASVTKTGYSGKACKATITNGGTSSWGVQVRQNIPITAGKTYTLTFKASADANRTIGFVFQKNASPYTTWLSQASISLTTTPTAMGPYTFDCTTTDATNLLSFLLGGSTTNVYIDDVVITEEDTSSGYILYQRWDGISGTLVSDLTSNSNYPNTPTSSSSLTLMEAATNVADNYGARIAGYISAPATGSYTFWIAGDDNSQLWLSTNNNAANKVKIAEVPTWTNSREWNKLTSQKSSTINLVQGQSYYVEAIMKEGSGGDNLAVGWLKPGQTGTVPSEVVPGSVLSPLVFSTVAVTGVTVSPTSATITEGDTQQLTATVSPANATNQTVSWSSSNASAATVSTSGLVTAIAAGTATITVTTQDGNKTATCAITVIPPSGGTGNILYQRWDGISGTLVSDLTSNSNYPNTPTSSSSLTLMEAATNVADNYGARIAGYISAPATGSYTFWIAGDDNSQLWLSTNNNAANKVKIAEVPTWTNSREWNKFTSQKSSTINLVQGQSYYVEALMKEGSGGDNLAVGWLKPGQTGTVPSEVVPGSVLSIEEAPSGNLIINPTFNTNTDNWSIYASSGAAASIASVTQTGYSGKACKATITNAGTSIWNVQMRQNIPLVNGKTYSISFKASAASARTIGLLFMKGISPYTTNYLNSNISITTTPTVYGPFTYQCNVTDNNNFFAFLLGGSTSSVYIDDVSIIESTTKSAIIASPVTEISGEALSSKVIMYPNPASNVLNIQITTTMADEATVNVVDLQGRVVSSTKHLQATEGVNRFEINTQFLEAGIYMVNVTTSEFTNSKMIVIKR